MSRDGTGAAGRADGGGEDGSRGRSLDAPTRDAEQRLWRRMLDEANVNLTPGSACRVIEPGFFRLCFASAPVEDSLEAVARLATLTGGVG